MLSAYATVSWTIEAALVYFDASHLAATAFLLLVWAVLVGPWYGAVVVGYHRLVRRTAAWTHPLLAGWCWAVGEWVRCRLGLPWCLLGHTQTMHLPVIQVADLGGAYAVTAVMAAVSVGLSQCVLRSSSLGARSGAGVAMAVLAATLLYGRARLTTEAHLTLPQVRSVAVVQTNVANTFEWQRAATARALGRYAEITAAALHDGPVDLVVWPEDAVNFYLDRDGLMRLPLGDVAGRTRDGLLVGAPGLADDGSARNAAYLINGAGAVRARYDKRRLLPFAEYRPWPLSPPAEALAYAPGTTSGILPTGDDHFGALICWDANFPSLARELVRDGAGFLVHLSNDAWLDEATHGGPAQHLTAAIFRAVETRRWVARAASTGISGFIVATGAVIDPIPMGTAGVRSATVPMRTDQSPYVRWGDAWLGVGGILAIVATRGKAAEAIA